MVKRHTAKWRWSQKCFFREVWIVEIPDVGLLWHVVWHLLETEHGVGNTDTKFGDFWMPRQTGSRSLEIVWILEDHESLGRDILREMLWLLTMEIFFKEIDLVILSNTSRCTLDHISCSLRKTKRSIPIKILLISLNIHGFGWIDVGGPATFFVAHAFG